MHFSNGLKYCICMVVDIDNLVDWENKQSYLIQRYLYIKIYSKNSKGMF